jgi:hypothetical protein
VPADPSELDHLDETSLMLGHAPATDRHEGQIARGFRP